MTQDWRTDWGADLAPDWAEGEGDAAFDNSAHVPDAVAIVEGLVTESAAFRADLGARVRLDIAYGSHPREALDLFLPEGPPLGLIVFIHGGYWQMRNRTDWSVLAQGALALGYAVAMPSYPLAPEVSIADITQSVAAAVTCAAGMVEGPIYLCGHSAGGHLAARMACVDGPLRPDVADRLVRVTPISGLHDLRPFMEAERMNGVLGLTHDMSMEESPALTSPKVNLPVTAWVGGDERPELIRQSKVLAHAWGAQCSLHIVPGVNHFTVVLPLKWTDSLLLRHILDGQDCEMSQNMR